MKHLLLFTLLALSLNIKAQSDEEILTIATIKVTATDYENKARANEVVTLQSKRTKKEFVGVTDSAGKVDLKVPKGDTYTVYQRTINNFVTHGEIEIPEGKNKYTMNLKLELKVLENKMELKDNAFSLDMIFFETGGSKLTTDSYETIDNLFQVLVSKPTMHIGIAGHTDNIGNKDANLKLSQDRANVIRDELVKKGIDISRIDTKGYGSEYPKTTNDTPEGRAKNRRIEVKIISY